MKIKDVSDLDRRIMSDIERRERWEQEQADLADDLLKVIGAVALAGLGFLAGFQMGTMRANAATLTRAHLRTAPYYTAGTLMVEPITESTAEGELPEAIDITPTEAETEPAEEWVSLGTFRTTGFCNCRKCCGKWAGGKTASGTWPEEGRTIAVDKKVIPMGMEVMIDGNVYRAEDTGSGIYGNRIDIYYEDHSRAWNHGVQYKEVFVRR